MPRWARNLMIAVGILAALIAIPAIPWLYLGARYHRELQAELDRIRAAGEPLTLAEAAPRPVPDSQNAAPLYAQVFAVDLDAKAISTKASGLRRYVLPDGYRPDDLSTAALARPLLSRPDVRRDLELVRRGSERPYCVFALRSDNLYAAHDLYYQFRQGIRLAAARAALAASDGDLMAAADWLSVCYGLADHASSGPLVVDSMLVGIACQGVTDRTIEAILDRADVTPAVAKRLRQGLDRFRIEERAYRALLGERALVLSRMESPSRRGRGGLAGGLGALVQPYLDLEKLTYLRGVSAVMGDGHRPYRELAVAPPTDIHARPGSSTASIALPILQLVPRKRDQAIASRDLLRAVLDLKVWKHQHGSYPAALPAAGVKPPEDVFSGRPVRYQRRGLGFAIWSVGPNLKDDGGTRAPRSGDIAKVGDLVWEVSR